MMIVHVDVAMASLKKIQIWLIWLMTLTLIVTEVWSEASPMHLRFTQSVYNATIPENSLGKTFVTPTTKMGIYVPDDSNIKISYEIVNSDDLFKAEDYLVGDFSFLLVRTHSNSYGRLNREFRSEYRLQIQAIAEDENGTTTKTSTDLIVFVSDLNDLQPLFDHEFYNITVREDTPLHASIVRVSAYDGDAGINAEVYYSFMDKTNVFAVHPTTGIVTLTRPLNYFLQKTYTYDILAQDRGPQTALHARRRPAKLKVNVEQVNFFAPEISLKTLPVVIEPGQDEVLLALASVVDKDIGQNGKIKSLTVLEEDLKNTVIVDRDQQEGDFIIKLKQNSLSSDLYAGFNVTLLAEDMGNNVKISNKSFHVSVLDTSKMPKFTQRVYDASVEELVPVNTPVVFVSVSEVEHEFDVRFEITDGNEYELFKINPNTGLISTSDYLDAENISEVSIKVIVHDLLRNSEFQAESTTVKIKILDINDNAPEFSIPDQISEIYIQENLPVGSSVFKISAIDRDKNENGKISFSVANVKKVPFDIDPFSGIIKTTEYLDFEAMKHTYKLIIRASDWGTPFSRETEMIFRINLQDENDNIPEFEKNHCSGKVAKHAPLSTELLTVPAVDFDMSDVVTYEIQSGNDAHCFQLDDSMATLTLNCSGDDLTETTYTLTIVAKDGIHTSEPVEIELLFVDSDQSSELANGIVSIHCQDTDVLQRLQEMVTKSSLTRSMSELAGFEMPAVAVLNQHQPVFSPSVPASLEISEGSAVGTVLTIAGATDSDPGYNGMLVYVIKSGDNEGNFKVDTHTGGLIVMSELDREKTDLFDLVIQVSDLGTPSLSANISIHITILDENDNIPEFESDHYSATVSENIKLNATVTQVEASDKDMGENAEIIYTIVSDTDHFRVDPKTGSITVNKALDRERYPLYEILVRASDKGSKLSLSSTATVAVAVTDVNDVVPTFTPELYSVRIREDLPLGAVVTVVTAADTDYGANGEVTYHLVYGEDYFEIDSDTGVIRIIKELDFEVQQVHNVSVRAEDGGTPPLMSVCFINIEIVDVNENLLPPVFDNFFAYGYVNENEPVGTTVMIVTAHDPDGDEDSVSYSIRDGSGLGRFTIDANGTVCTSQVLDRETATHYWLTVYAQDHGLVPLHTRLEVYIEVKDVNDNIPMTFEPVYYASVPENSNEPGRHVAQVQAFDLDQNPSQKLTYKITRFDPKGFFTIDRNTGEITTTGKKLDREKQEIYPLEVTVSDNGSPNLTYETKVMVKVSDENDNKPEFSDRLYRIHFPATPHGAEDTPVFQVLAWDEDEGTNGELTFDIRKGKDDSSIFRVDPVTGVVMATQDLRNGDVHHFVVRASDHGKPRPRRATSKVRIEVLDRPWKSFNAPKFVSPVLERRVMEDDKVGHMVELLQAVDMDGDMLWYSIIAGDPDHHFYIGLEAGNLMVARKLDWETKCVYNLTVQVTDGLSYDNCTVIIQVINIDDNYPQFSSASYIGSYPESTPVGSTLLKVEATDADQDRLMFTLLLCCNSRASLDLFRIDPESGDIKVKNPLDREVATQHNLTVMVRGKGTNSNRNYTRVTINVLDHNDHQPKFLSDVFFGRVFETAAIGTSVVQVLAVDSDRGQNAEITYSILTGNMGDMFSIDQTLGTVSVAKDLDRQKRSEYNLVVMATDGGKQPLSSTALVKIAVTVSDNAPPKFLKSEYMAELHENEPWFTNVFTLNAECRSSLIYMILGGNDKGYFAVNPNSGVVYTKKPVDFEEDKFFNLTVKATSIIHASDKANLVIHIIDENDNAPEFNKEVYSGHVTEMAKPGTVVLNSTEEPLVIDAVDKDSNLNALLTYEIRDDYAKEYFTVDHNTGAIRTVTELDHENFSKMEFTVEVWDMGKPRQRSKTPAKVVISIDDINDTPPKFMKELYTAEVLLPTYKDVIVARLNATDDDSGINTKLTFTITSGNEAGKFSINTETGEIVVVNETDMADSYNLDVKVSDGLFDASAAVEVHVVKTAGTTIRFSKEFYEIHVKENDQSVKTLSVIQVADKALNEQFLFSLLNGQGKFVIGRTSGVIQTTGKSFDREMVDVYHLVVEVRKETKRETERAHIVVIVIVDDENDNAPMFVNQPYHAVIVYDAKSGDTIKQVSAIDHDAGENGRVIYSLSSRGDLEDKFRIESLSGRITLTSPLKESDVGKEISLAVQASDNGFPMKFVHSSVKLTIISKSYPVFDHQVYKGTIPENSPKGASVLSLEASSPTGQKLIYSIIEGDPNGAFSVDFNIGVITVKGEIDYEMTSSYNLTVQATEALSGLSTTTLVIIQVLDKNDQKPVFSSPTYTVAISEAIPSGSSVVKVAASDEDTGSNGQVQYSLAPVKRGNRDIDWFSIDAETGIISTRMFLDREKQSEFEVKVIGTDGGMPQLSSTAVVKIELSDINNNAPVFDQPSYHCVITDQVQRGQLVTKVSATDPDISSAGLLRYSIVGGNDRQTFQMHEQKGIVSISEQRKPDLHPIYELNISVSDGVFTNFARVSIKLQNSNNHAPKFERPVYVAEFQENYDTGMLVTQVSARDYDPGTYGMLTYSIISQEMAQNFRIDADSGEIFSNKVLDREVQALYTIPVAATDNGGRMGFTTVHVSITDQNDNIPQFLAREYKVTILATSPVNSTVIQIEAEDPDSGSNGEVTYSFSSGASPRISEMFYIDPSTGVITVRRSLEQSANEIFQFFVTAVDNGTPQMKNKAPVSMWITDASEAQPKFKQDSYSFFLLEDVPVSSVIATVSATSSVPLEHIIIPGFTESSNSPTKFGIDGKGRIHVARQLDREKTSTFTLTIQAQTLSKQPLIARTKVNIGLIDVNDNYPYFESNPYEVTIAEHSDTNIDLVQVVAHDLDKTSKFTYSFDEEVQQYSHLFSLDRSTGVITLLSKLDREQQDIYNITVWVTDGDGSDALKNSTVVQLKVTDHNDNPPVFSRSHYQAAINEDAYPGTILLTLSTEDKDDHGLTETRYYIIEGDPYGRFQVRKTGDVFVNRPLDRELVPRYKLTVAATDGGFVSTATVTIDVLDANDNSPVCKKAVIKETVSEDASFTYVITRIKATDADEYGNIIYQLSGPGAEKFKLDRTTGILTIYSYLDREDVSSYTLVASAVDKGGKSCTTEIQITVSDVNDNAPVFVPGSGAVMMSEGDAVNTLVYRVSANDFDAGVNQQVEFSLKNDDEGTFKINPKTGLIQLGRQLDRETKAGHKITVVATDKGTPSLSSELEIEIIVRDINDNPPEFEQTTYFASVPENAAIGQIVTRIQATSKDTGINAQISYYIQAGMGQEKFSIDPTSGIITTTEELDHETMAGYILTVRAQDHGDPPLSNTAYVQVNVTDVNDSPPLFYQSVYSAKIREDVPVGTKVIQVLVTDLDSDLKNRAVNFTIENGDHLHTFEIEKSEGNIIVNTPLDRETVSSYVLHVRATNYHLFAEAMVNIEVLDANDCPPQFGESNYTLYVQMNSLIDEDKEIMSGILQFSVTDDDLDPNGPPFTFDIIEGDEEKKFQVDKLGNLRIASKLNRQVTATYELVVRVFDNGTPAMYSDVDVEIHVIEESTFSPEVTNLDVSISSYRDDFPGGVIGHLKAYDGDKYDSLIYEVVSTNRHLFDIDKNDGRIIAFAGLDAGNYVINISVSDGKYTTYGKVDIAVSSITDEMIANSVTLQIANMEPMEFLKNYKKEFQKVIKQELSVRTKDVEIISVQKSDDSINLSNRPKRDVKDSIDVLFAVKKGQEYIPQNRLWRKVSRSEDEIEESLNIEVVKVFTDLCEDDMCDGGECGGYVEFDKDSLVPVMMDTESFVVAKHRYTYECICPNGNIGDNCLPNPRSCDQKPCPRYKICSPHPVHGYTCDCPEGKSGRHCEKQMDNKCPDINCNKGDTPITFSGNSYARWTLLESIENRLSLSLRIKTRRETASLMYAKGRVDYSILELVDGKVQYRFDCGSGEGLVTVPENINDGEWHIIMVERHGNQAEIFLDGQFSAITIAPGINDELNLESTDVYFGAEVEIYTSGYTDVRKGFHGCMEDIRIYNVRLPVSGNNAVALSQKFEKVEFSCKDDAFAIVGNNVCSSFPCLNGGKCEPDIREPNSYICRCSERYWGAKCEVDKDPCRERPCLNNGICRNVKGIPNEFSCECVDSHQGRRCEYGKFCIPNPCLHGGTCVEGPVSFVCLCKPGFSDVNCGAVVDICHSNPCQNQGICVQEGTSYYCNCTGGHHGRHCEDIVLPAITSNEAGITHEEIYAILGVVGGIILIVLIFVLVRFWRRQKSQSRRANVTAGIANDGNEVYLNLLKSDKHNYKADNMLKNELLNKNKLPPSPRPPPVPDRPISYTPSNRDSLQTLNNFDSLRNYDTATEDHLQNIPAYNLDFLQTFAPARTVASVAPILPPPPPANFADTDSIQKEPWEYACQNILQNYMTDKHSDKMSKSMPVGTVEPMTRLQGQETTSFSSLPNSDTEDDLPGYHWDTSDWAPDTSLPNISELPVGECPDSPGSASPQSSDSNTHINNVGPGVENEITYIQNQNDGDNIDSEYVGDSEYTDNELDMEHQPDSPNYEQILAEQNKLLEDYELPKHNINVHPDYYLPLNSSFTSDKIPLETLENWSAPPGYNISDSSASSDDDNDSVLHYGFPPTHSNINRLSMITTDSDINGENRLSAVYTSDSEFNGEYNRVSAIDDLSVGDAKSRNASMSDISGLCEIEDSEDNILDDSEDENTPLPTQRIHTEV